MLIIYIVIAASTVLAPVIVYFAMGDRAAAILGGWRKWLEENDAVVTAVVLLVFVSGADRPGHHRPVVKRFAQHTRVRLLRRTAGSG